MRITEFGHGDRTGHYAIDDSMVSIVVENGP